MDLNAPSSNPTHSFRGLPWFSTKGQIAQLVFAILACIFGGIKAFPEMKNNEFFSLGALLFYILVALVVTMFCRLAAAIRNARSIDGQVANGLSGTLQAQSPEMLLAPIDALKHSHEDLPAETEARGLAGRTWPSKVFTVQDIRADLSSDPKVDYKDKVRLILTNATGEDLSVWTPVWESDEVHAQRPFGSMLYLYGSAGWKVEGSWDDGHSCITLPPGQTFMCWIGLLEPAGEGIKQRLKKENTGTAIFPVKIAGRLYEVPVEL